MAQEVGGIFIPFHLLTYLFIARNVQLNISFDIPRHIMASLGRHCFKAGM
jgi:hypothetical protein